jgi:hypothetical protein
MCLKLPDVKTYLLLIFSALFAFTTRAQKPPLHHDVYDSWQQISSTTLSPSGDWLAVLTEPQEGDGAVALYQKNTLKIQLERAHKVAFSPDERHLLFMVKPTYEATRKAKRDGKKKDDLPKDVFVTYHLQTGALDTVKNVIQYDIPKHFGQWYALKMGKEKSAKKDTTATVEEKTDRLDAPSSKKKSDDEKGATILLRKFADTLTIRIENVLDYALPDSATTFYYTVAKTDSAQPAAVWMLSLKNQQSKLLDSGLEEYVNLATNPNGKYATFMGTKDSAKAEIKTFDWYFFVEGKKRWRRSGVWNDSLVINKDYKPVFTDDNTRLFFGVSPTPRPLVKDSLQLDEEKVNLDLWSWNDPYIQPMQLKNKESDAKKSFRMVFWISENKYVPLTNNAVSEVNFSSKFTTEWLSAYNSDPYKIRATWEYPSPRDLYIVNSKTGKKRLVKREVKGYGAISAGGDYLYWYDQEAQLWMVYNIESKKLQKASESLPHASYDEDWDMPAPPRAYGAAGFTQNDSLFVFYDRYDVWGYHFPTKTLICLTEGKGREQKIQLRYQNIDKEINYVEWPEGIYLKGFNETTKGHSIHLASPDTLLALLEGPFQIQQIEKAKNNPVFVHRRGNFLSYPEVFRSTGGLGKGSQLTSTNPQQQEYNWASVELISWKAYDGTPLEGLLYKPENFDPNKEYPLLV